MKRKERISIKNNLLTLIPFIAAVGCLVAYNIIGCEVAPDGTLLESFFLIPMSYLFIAIGITAGIVSFFRKGKKSDKNKDN